ncbi:hypothetical protein, partial [Micromonospora sp. NPDC005113]
LLYSCTGSGRSDGRPPDLVALAVDGVAALLDEVGPTLSRHYVALSPAAQRDMTLREIHAHLLPLAPATERDALMAQHPALRGDGG